VFASVSPRRFAVERARGIDVLFREVLADVSPELAERVFSAASAPRLRAFAGAPGVLRRSVGPGWALVGDAGYFQDPLTAHGITDALRDAELLARAATAGDAWAFEEYQQVRDALARPLMDVTGRIASLDWTLAEVQALHVELSRTMSAEVDVIRGWDAAPVAA
jgi:flavin-dependent dehydrogenase